MIADAVQNPAYSSLEIIDTALTKLRELALTTNFRDHESRKRFLMQFLIIRNRYAEAEEKLSGVSVPRANSSELSKYLSRPIHQKQMSGWISKLRKNIHEFVRKMHSHDAIVRFLQSQGPLLQVVVKVLNGDAFFVGIEHDI